MTYFLPFSVKSRTLLQVEEIGETDSYEELNNSNNAVDKFQNLLHYSQKGVENISGHHKKEVDTEIIDSKYETNNNEIGKNIQHVIELNKDQVNVKWRRTHSDEM